MTEHHSPTTTVSQENGVGAVRVEDTFATSPGDLWAAITQPERLARWIATVAGDLTLGGSFHATFTSGWDGPGVVEVCEPPTRLVLHMAAGTDDESVIDATLTPVPGGTRLVVEERGFTPDELPFHAAGWQVHVEDLGSYLAGSEPGDWRTRWAERLPAFRTE